jgi:hypothetical protein
MARAPWTLVLVSLVGLGLAAIVPDEPFHLSGVCLTVGVGAASLGLIVALAQGFSAVDPERRRNARRAAIACGLIVLGMTVYFYADFMSEFS